MTTLFNWSSHGGQNEDRLLQRSQRRHNGDFRHISISTRQRSLQCGQNLRGPFLRATLAMRGFTACTKWWNLRSSMCSIWCPTRIGPWTATLSDICGWGYESPHFWRQSISSICRQYLTLSANFKSGRLCRAVRSGAAWAARAAPLFVENLSLI